MLLALGTMVAILVVGMGLLSAATQEYKTTARVKYETKALALAEAGVEWGVNQVSYDHTYSGTGASPIGLADGTYSCDVVSANGSDDKIITGTGLHLGVQKRIRVIARQMPFAFPNAALCSKGNIEFSGSHPRTTTVTATGEVLHEADIYANGSITGSGTSTIDGKAYAVGSISGIEAVEGTAPGAPPAPFPKPYQIAAWTAAWRANALSGGTIPPPPNGTDVVGPKFISGSVTGDHDFSGPAGAVIWIDGNWVVKSARATTNCTIIVNGTISMGPNSDFRNSGDPFSTIVASLSTSTNAIEIEGNGSSNPYGLVYALNGGIRMNGNSDFSGAFIADKGITFVGGGQIYYPAGLTTTSYTLRGDYVIISYQVL